MKRRRQLLRLHSVVGYIKLTFIEHRRNDAKEKNRTCPSTTLSTKNHTVTGLSLRGERPAPNCLGHGKS